MNGDELNFQDTKVAFASKSNGELQRKYWLFRLMNSPFLVNIGTGLTQFALGARLPVKNAIKATIFRQFCGGETIQECERAINELGKSHIGTILDYSVEGISEEADFEATKEEIIRTI